VSPLAVVNVTEAFLAIAAPAVAGLVSVHVAVGFE